MMHGQNEINDYIQMEESSFFDRKSARIKPVDIVKHIIGFANASGGQLVIGIEDDGSVTGFSDNEHKVGEFEKAIFSGALPTPKFVLKKIDCWNNKSQQDFVLVIDVEASHNSVIFTPNNKECYLRSGDSTIALNHKQILDLEYEKGERSFEDQIIPHTSLEDVDEELIGIYKKYRKCENISTEQVLRSRGFLKNGNLTNAGILLFGKEVFQYLPNSRIRFLRYDGTIRETGSRLNVIKEFDYEGPIPVLIEKMTTAIKSQLRDFNYLHGDGKFDVVTEYPEFAWFEGVVNALVHRDYSYAGDYVRVIMYDDRLEIISPGKLPNIVTLENMRTTRYSRNPRISRTLTEFGWVREMNEGVNRIYDEMRQFYLKEPIYSEPEKKSVSLMLENNIVARYLRNESKVVRYLERIGLDNLKPYEKNIIATLFNRDKLTVKEAAVIIDKSTLYTGKILKSMREKGLVQWHGTNTYDPTQYYTLITGEEYR